MRQKRGVTIIDKGPFQKKDGKRVPHKKRCADFSQAAFKKLTGGTLDAGVLKDVTLQIIS